MGVSPEIASAARERIVQGATDTAKGVLTLVGPPAEMVQAAYMSGNPTAIDQVQAMQQAQTQAYARNGLAGASAMVISSLGIELVGIKGTGALMGAAEKASEIVRLSKTPAEAAAGKLDEAALFEKQAIEREAQAAKEARGKDGVVAKKPYENPKNQPKYAEDKADEVWE